MTISLPEPIAAYFAADRLNAEAVARCFTKEGVVKDEGHTYVGLDTIKRWKAEASAKYTYTCEPLLVEQQGRTRVVTCHLEGDFPGGAVDLRFFFRLKRAKIANLEIIP